MPFATNNVGPAFNPGFGSFKEGSGSFQPSAGYGAPGGLPEDDLDDEERERVMQAELKAEERKRLLYEK